MATENLKNKCQYWVEERQCKYWNVEDDICGYTDSSDYSTTLAIPSAYKSCNYIGTDLACSHFDDEGVEPKFRCILPDPTRHIGNYKSSSKYAFYINDPGDGIVLDTSLITGYSEKGLVCEAGGESGGTNKSCSGYSPFHLGFGKILPTKNDVTVDSKFSFRLPLNYSVLNLRSSLSTCYWWRGPIHIFELSELDHSILPYKSITSTSGVEPQFEYPEISEPTGCSRSDTLEYTKHSTENYACNGSNTNCTHYTGVCWQHAVNDKLETGDKVLAEQVLELRYYLKEDDWTYDLYSEFGFTDLQINAYANIKSYEPNKEVIYNVANIDLDFDQGTLAFKSALDVLTEGTEVKQDSNSEDTNETNAINFPTLIKNINNFLLSPYIINNFFNYYDKNVLETHKANNSNILLLGNQHTYVHDSVCINISKLKKFPTFLKYTDAYPDVNKLYANTVDLPGEPDNCAFINKFDFIQKEFDTEIDKVRLEEPDCIFDNILDKETKAFMFDVTAEYGKNELIVLSRYEHQGSKYWGYNVIIVYVTYVSGFLVQNSYNIEESRQLESNEAFIVDRLYDYRRSLYGYSREISFEFIPYTDKSLNYKTKSEGAYNDFKAVDLLDLDLSYTGNKLHRYRNTFNYVEVEDLHVVGPSGYVLVNINDTDNIITEAYGDIELKFEEDSDLFLEFKDKDGATLNCPMEVIKQGQNSGLAVNQFLIKPKNMDDYKAICGDTRLYLNELLIPARFNPEDVPTLTYNNWILEEDPAEVDLSVLASGSIEQSINSYKINNFNCGLIIAVGVVGVSGKIINLIKIKLAVWVKLPMTPDVEMYYSWTADYDSYQNFPTCRCCGAYTRKRIKSSTRSFSAACGDHEVSPTTGIGKMWFPYVQCENFSYYKKISNQIYGGVTTVVGLYKEVDSLGERINGSWNLRMEGPAENDYYTGYYCCSICPCSCQVLTYNVNRKAGSDSHFSGMCRYRGEIGQGTLKYWLETGGGLPRFGNVLRPQFLSYRSTDYIQYIYYDIIEEDYKTKWKWMPSNMSFTDIDPTKIDEQVYEEFCNQDILPINALGTMLMTNLDGKGVLENIREERYRFEEVFEVYLEDEKMAFPKALHSNNNNPVLQYKSINTSPIQWAWRDIHKNIQRNYNEDENDETSLGIKLNFIDVFLTPYAFNMHNMEQRLTCDEGVHIITFTPPILDDDTGEYEEGVYPTLKLDNGLERCFTWQKQLDPEDCHLENDPGYSELTTASWMSQGLFDNDFSTTIEEAEEDEKILETASLAGTIKKYYNRGVSFDFTDELSSQTVPVVHTTATEGLSCNPQILNNLLMEGQIQELEFSFMEIKKAISMGSIPFKYGIESITEDGLVVSYLIHCVPAFSIIVDGVTVFSSDCKIPTFFGIREEVIDFSYCISINYLTKRSETFKITLDLTIPKDYLEVTIRPDITYKARTPQGKKYDITYGYYTSVGAGSLVDDSAEEVAELVTLFDTVITAAAETIYVTERKYKASFFAGDPIPPHGVNVGERVLAGRTDKFEYDTVWQIDKDGSVVNLPDSEGEKDYIHKTRTRFVFEAYNDTEYIHEDLRTMESTQEDLYNTPMEKDTMSVSYTSIMYPNMDQYFDAHNLQNISPSSTGSLSNNILYKLGTLRHYDKMQGKGFQLLPSNPWRESCTGGSNIDGCHGDDVFIYNKVNMDDGSSEGSSYDALNIFYEGTTLMLQRISIAKFLVSRMSSTYAASNKGKVFEEGEPMGKSIPEFMPAPGRYDTTPEWYKSPRERDKWPVALPGLWPSLVQIF